MPKGSLSTGEAQSFRDEKTGALIRQVTTHPSIHHHPFYYIPAYDDAMNCLFFVSHRTGRPELFAELRESGKLLQMTERESLNEWSVHPSHGGKYVYYTAGTSAWRIAVDTLKEEEICSFGAVEMKEKSMVAAGMGTTTVSRDDLWWAVPVKVGKISQFHVIDLVSGKHEVILERDTISHPQFHPNNTDLLRYGGPYYDRIWVINRDGSGNRLAYKRNAEKKEWIVHETWMPGRYEILTANWPHGVISIDIHSGKTHPVCSFNAWHPMVNRQGDLMVCDTNFPDNGLQLFDPRDGIGTPRTLCLSRASNQGAHWNTDHCPYDDGPVEVYAPQHTHPHPNFSPDGRKVVFGSDFTGHAQVCEADVPQP